MASDGVVIIGDPKGSHASILPGYGFNCFSFKAQTEKGLVETLWAEDGFTIGSPPLFSGIPILYPFGGRLDGNTFRWDGKTYTVTDAPTYNGNILHGFVIIQPWRVVEQSQIRVVGEFQASIDKPELLDQWPTDFAIRVAYEVNGSSLTCDVTLWNPSDSPSPWGFTTHGYYRVPLGGSDPGNCIVTIPANKTWELIDMLPTGKTIPVAPDNDLRGGRPLAGLELDAIYTDVNPEPDGSLVASIHDPESGLTMTITSTGPYREFVVFTPPHREAIAIEPYTCSPTTFDLHERGFDAGLRVLQPGESQDLRVVMTLA